MGAAFRKLASSLAKQPGVTDPAALAAAIGRKKYGAARYNKAASKGVSPKLPKAPPPMGSA